MGNVNQTSANEVNLPQKSAPNTTGILVLGILSIIPGVATLGLLGIILGIITLSLAAGTHESINENPGKYSKNSIQLVKAGKTCGIIGITLSALFFIFLIVYAISFGASLMANPDYYL